MFVPKWHKGERITARKLNQLADAVQSTRIVSAQGLVYYVTPGGTVLSVQTPPQGAVCYTTSLVTAASGATPGTGSAKLGWFDGTSFQLFDPEIDITIFHNHEKKIANNSWVTIHKVDGYWFSVNTPCGNLTT